MYARKSSNCPACRRPYRKSRNMGYRKTRPKFRVSSKYRKPVKKRWGRKK